MANYMDQKIAVIGMGKTGQAVARFLQGRGCHCEGFDEHHVRLPEDMKLPMHIGKLKGDVLAGFDRIIVSPGIAWHHPALLQAREAHIPMCGDLDLFCEQFAGDLLAVTGTNGKTTTVTLIHTLLDTLHGGIEAGGNIGTPMLELLHLPELHRAVLELSSFQLERSDKIHPKWAVLLNLQPDHADMHDDPASYEAAKRRLFEHQGNGDTALLPADARWHALAGELTGRGVTVKRFGEFGEHESLAETGIRLLADGGWELFWHQHGEFQRLDAASLRLRGRHQHMNLAVAAQAAADFGVSPAVIHEALTSFRGLHHRLEHLGHIAMHDWYNDSKATNPDAAIAALQSFDRVVWICGGLRKGLKLEPMRETVAHHVAQALVIGKEPEPYCALLETAGVPYRVAKSVERAVAMAAESGTSLPVLLSPAAASQDQFRDYAERGAAFAAAVHALGRSA